MAESSDGTPSGPNLADQAGVAILEFGRGWMLDPATTERANELGLDGAFGFWVNGRAGVLGNAESDLAASAIGFMHHDLVRQFWEGRPTTMSALAAADLYAEAAATWGREKLTDISAARLTRLNELNRRIADSVVPSMGALFTGWRALSPPTDPAGAVTVSLNVLREMRGGAHIHAVHTVGLGPDGAIASNDDPVRGGSSGLARFGWPLPHPNGDAKALNEAERMTSLMVQPAFAVLEGSEQGEYLELVAEIRATMDT